MKTQVTPTAANAVNATEKLRANYEQALQLLYSLIYFADGVSVHDWEAIKDRFPGAGFGYMAIICASAELHVEKARELLASEGLNVPEKRG